MYMIPELKVPLASSGDTNLDSSAIIIPSDAFNKTNKAMEPIAYYIKFMFK